jgi:iron complex transport system permease protein
VTKPFKFSILTLCSCFALYCFTLITFHLPGIFFESTPQNWLIFWRIDVPRVLLSILVGGTLAILGLIFQALFQNPMASPYTSGVSSAAALGAGLMLFSANFEDYFPWLSLTGGAFVSAGLALGMLLLLIKLRPFLDPSSLVLCGLVCNYFFSSLLLLVQYFSDPSQLYALSHWLMGNLNTIGYQTSIIIAACSVTGLIFFGSKHKALDLACLGDEVAITKGLNIAALRRDLLIVGSILVTVLVAHVGPIGFVGIIVPHISRILTGYSHKVNFYPTFILGAIFLSLSDLIARSCLEQTELPVGLITSLIGAPIFIFMLIRSKTYKFS